MQQKPRVLAQDVDHGQAVALAHLEVVEVVRRGDLHRARALLGIRILVGDDRNAAADDGQDHVLADEMLVALIVRVNGDRGVAEHGLGPRGGDDDEGGRVFGIEGRALDGIAQMPEVPLGLDLLDFQIGNRGQELRVPIDEALVLVDEAGAMKLDEHFADGLRQPLVHGEAEPRPVAGGTEALELADDGVAGLFLPLPDALDELLTAERAAVRLLALHQLALDHHLRGDAGMVGAGLPQHVAAAHALEADQHVLQRVVQRVPHMERAGDVGRRDDDGEGLRPLAVAAVGSKGARVFPGAIDVAFEILRLIRFIEHGTRTVGEKGRRASYALGFRAVNGWRCFSPGGDEMRSGRARP